MPHSFRERRGALCAAVFSPERVSDLAGDGKHLADRGGTGLFKWSLVHVLAMLPVYYVSLVAACIIYRGEGYAYWLGGRSVSAGNVASHFLGLFGLNPYWINSLIGVEWYLGDLFLFYLLVPLIRGRLKDLRSTGLALAGSAATSLMLTAAAKLFLAEQIAGSPVVEAYILNFCLVQQLPVFLLGAALYYMIPEIRAGWNDTVCRRIAALCMIAAAGGMIFLMYFGTGPLPVALVSGVVFGLFFAGVRLFPAGHGKASFLAQIGRVSYGIYLFHFLLLQVFRRAGIFQGDALSALSLRYLAAFAGTLALAVMADRFLTKPVKRVLERKIFIAEHLIGRQ